MFQNLKKLNGIVSGKEISGIFVNIRNAKSSLDTLCKKIKEQITKNETAVLAEAQKAAQKTINTTEVNTSTEKQSVNVLDVKPSSDKEKLQENKVHFNKPHADAGVNRGAKPPYQPREEYQPREGYKPREGYQQRDGARPQNFNARNNYAGNAAQQNTNYAGKPYAERQQQTGYGNRPQSNYAGNKPNTGYAGRPQQGDNKGKPNIISFTANKNQKPKNFKPEPVPFIAPTKQNTLGGNKAKSKISDAEKKGLNLKEKIRLGHIRFDNYDSDDESVIRVKGKRQKEIKKQERIEITNAVITEDVLTVKILSERIGKPSAEIIKKLLLLGLMYNINSIIDFTTAELVASEFGITLEHKVGKTYEEQLEDLIKENSEEGSSVGYTKRPPVVAVMGHVDHGKTSLLDYIKKSHVVLGEAGGITQHIGAYSIKVNDQDITFIDTPGHEAFSEMRARGATVADVAILIIAADDGVMPQTVEAIKHIKDAGVPMVVAVNKIDKPAANIERVKQQLTEHDVLVEEWGGDTICVPISAHSGVGIDKLLEMILLVSDINEFKANPNAMATGTCIESKVDVGRGIVATIIIKDGTLKIGDYVICGLSIGRVRAMTDYKGQSVTQAGPSMAVSVVGLNSVPQAGEMAYVVDEKFAKNIILERSNKLQVEKTQQSSGTSLEDFLSQSADNEIKTFKIIIKADVQGTSEALKQTLEKVKNEEVVVNCISNGVGIINESDILLAKSSNVQIIGFNTKVDAKARAFAERNGVTIKLFKIIYEAVDYVTNVINSMKTPKFKENVIGKVEVRQLFKISSIGVIAGSYVLEGVVNRNSQVKLMRNNEIVAETVVENLQQQKDEAKQVKAGFECGIKLKGYNDIKVGDILVIVENVKI